MTLVEFYLARLAEVEQVAQATDALELWTASAEQFGPRVQVGGGHWDREVEHAVWTCDDEQDGCPAMNRAQMAEARHIALHDPASVLRDVESKRDLVRLHGRMAITKEHPQFNDAHLTTEPMTICRSCEPETMWRRERSWPCRTLRALVLPFVDHPEYNESWRV